MQRAQQKTSAHLSADIVQRILDENQQLILAAIENQQIHNQHECSEYLNRLQHNLMMLGTIGDEQVNSAGGMIPLSLLLCHQSAGVLILPPREFCARG